LTQTRERHSTPGETEKARSERLRYLGVALLVASALLWVAVLAVPLLPLAAGWKVGIGTAIVVVAEVAFWLSALILGREVVWRYRRYLNPRNWGKSGEDR
jgi:hypothetical protein